jgi:hypothetical protein
LLDFLRKKKDVNTKFNQWFIFWRTSRGFDRADCTGQSLSALLQSALKIGLYIWQVNVKCFYRFFG